MMESLRVEEMGWGDGCSGILGIFDGDYDRMLCDKDVISRSLHSGLHEDARY